MLKTRFVINFSCSVKNYSDICMTLNHALELWALQARLVQRALKIISVDI